MDAKTLIADFKAVAIEKLVALRSILTLGWGAAVQKATESRPEDVEKARAAAEATKEKAAEIKSKLEGKVPPIAWKIAGVVIVALCAWFLLDALLLFAALFVAYVLITLVLRKKNRALPAFADKIALPAILAISLLVGLLPSGGSGVEYAKGDKLEVVVREPGAPGIDDIIEVRPEKLKVGEIYKIGYYQVSEVHGTKIVASINPNAYMNKKNMEAMVFNGFGQAMMDAAENTTFPDIVLLTNRELLQGDAIPSVYVKYVGTVGGMRAYKEVSVDFKRAPEVLEDGLTVDLGKKTPFSEVFGIGLGRPPKKAETFKVKSKSKSTDGSKECILADMFGPFDKVRLEYTEADPPEKVLCAFKFTSDSVFPEKVPVEKRRPTVESVVKAAEKEFGVKMTRTSDDDNRIQYSWISDDYSIAASIGWIVTGGYGRYFYSVKHSCMKEEVEKANTSRKWTPVTGDSVEVGGKVVSFLGMKFGQPPAEVEKSLGNPLSSPIGPGNAFETYFLKKPFRFFDRVTTWYETDIPSCQVLEKLVLEARFYKEKVRHEDVVAEWNALKGMLEDKYGISFSTLDACHSYKDKDVEIILRLFSSGYLGRFNLPVYLIRIEINCTPAVQEGCRKKLAQRAEKREASKARLRLDSSAGASDL